MYAMVDVFANVFPNFNQLYMAGLMASPMGAHRDLPHERHVSKQEMERADCRLKRSGADLVLAGHQTTGSDFGQAILEIDDSSPRWSNPDV